MNQNMPKTENVVSLAGGAIWYGFGLVWAWFWSHRGATQEPPRSHPAAAQEPPSYITI